MDIPLTGHDPVLLESILHVLAPSQGEIFVDCTLGRGGHALAIAKRLGHDGLLIGLDADPRNLQFANDFLTKNNPPCRIRLFHANFADLDEVMAEANLSAVDGILADLGISTNQLLNPEYGLSFAAASPLDMRIDPSGPTTAADLINQLPERQLADLLYQRADERYSRRIARRIVEARRQSPILTTDRLAELVRSVVPTPPGHRHQPGRIDPATRTFMALRMAVNQELENLQKLLEIAPKWLRSPGGRLGIISFQSSEDRLVKQSFRQLEQANSVEILTKRPVGPSPQEVEKNLRARSAKLRVAKRR